MLEKINYPNLNAKLKGMYAKGLSLENIEDLLKQNRIKDAIIVLKSKLKPLESLADTAKRIEIEAKLDDIIINDINKIYRYLDKKTKSIFDAYILIYKLKVLKLIWKDMQIDNKVENLNYQDNWIAFFKDINGISKAQNQEEFLNYIKDIKLRKIFEESENLFELESNLTKYYLENIFKKVKGKSKALEDIISTEIDFINILSIYRSKKYYDGYNEKYFINYGKLIKRANVKLIEDINEIQDVNVILKNNQYDKIMQNDFEHNYKMYMYKKYKKCFREKTFDVSFIISYFYLQKVEQDNIISIIEGIRYRLDKEEIRKKITI